MTRAVSTRLPWLALAALLSAGTGCSSYVIRGTVIHGVYSDMSFVEPDDPRLKETPVSGVRVSVERDPDKLSRSLAGTDLSDTNGRFAVHVDAFGAGWMDEQWLIHAFKPGYSTASAMHELRPRHKEMRLLVTMTPGASSNPIQDDLIEQYERYK